MNYDLKRIKIYTGLRSNEFINYTYKATVILTIQIER